LIDFNDIFIIFMLLGGGLKVTFFNFKYETLQQALRRS